MTPIHVNNVSDPENSSFAFPSECEREVLDESTFLRMLTIERKRTERSKEPFLLMLLEAGQHQDSPTDEASLESMASVLLLSGRDTDIVGWYKEQKIVGVIFTGIVVQDKNLVLSTILSRVKNILQNKLKFKQLSQVSISFHFFPDDWDHSESGRPINPVLYPDLLNHDNRRRSKLVVKRVIDIVGSALALILTMPLLYIIGIAIKLSSKGPVLFRQRRVGQYGKRFTLFKFRSMQADNDHNIHKAFVTQMIASEAAHTATSKNGEKVYKLTNDSRITPVGKFLRRTSLDEFPQFLNVLLGDMSLVGPRPAVRYEVAAYQTWHRRRVLEFKPGITGLWQVAGRSRVKFDEMVRMDLRYAASWSIWLDLKILLLTPLAVLRGSGAY